jgi:hypothetical protein
LNVRSRDSGPGKLIDQRAGHSDDGIGGAESVQLNPLIQPVPPTATRKAVHGAYCRNPVGARGGATDHVSPIPMRVYDVGIYSADYVLETPEFAVITSRLNEHRSEWNSSSLEGRQKWVTALFFRRQHCRDMSEFGALGMGEHCDNALQAAFSGRVEDVQNATATTRRCHCREVTDRCPSAKIERSST